MKHWILAISLVVQAADAATADMTYQEAFSAIYGQADFTTAQEFLRWQMTNSADKNRDGKISAEEFTAFRKSFTGSIGEAKNLTDFRIVTPGGIFQKENWHAGDDEISFTEIELAGGKLAPAYLLEEAGRLGLAPETTATLKKILETYDFTASNEDIAQQDDLLNRDHGVYMGRQKAFIAVMNYSQLKGVSNDLPDQDEILKAALEFFVKAKNMPYVLNAGVPGSFKKSPNLYMHMASLSDIGVPGTKRIYLLRQVQLPYDAKAKKLTYREAADQYWKLLRDPASMTGVKTDRFVKIAGKQLKALARDPDFKSLLASYKADVPKEERYAYLQKIAESLAEALYILEPVSINVIETESGTIAGVTADQTHIDIYADTFNKVHGKWANDEDILKISLNAMTEELLHKVQLESFAADFDDNLRFYNDPFFGAQVAGEIGISWYENQPVEKTAKDLAAQFVESLFSKETN